MADWYGPLELPAARVAGLPGGHDLVDGLAAGPQPAEVLRRAGRAARPMLQPRCGVGGHEDMLELLRQLAAARPGFLSVTIDSYTRLGCFADAARIVGEAPGELNGYPLTAHGWSRGRELVDAVDVPLQIRHGSPDPRLLFAVSLASGILSFEGGPIGYTVPYSRDADIRRAWEDWNRVDRVCGDLAAAGVIVDRELFGTLTAVLVPPSISLACTLLEAVSAARAGVRCLSISYPQGGEAHQDVAALQALRSLAQRYLRVHADKAAAVEVHSVLHEFMGVFPKDAGAAEAVILSGGLVGRLGGATKIVTKTRDEAVGIPSPTANQAGIRTAELGAGELFDFVRLDSGRVAEEQSWIEQEVAELIDPVLADGTDLPRAVGRAFAAGRLDVPFSPNRHVRSKVVPCRDASGCIRYADAGHLPFSATTLRRERARLADRPSGRRRDALDRIVSDIRYVADLSGDGIVPVGAER